MAVFDEMVCFSLYSATRATTQAYRALLAPWGLTYPQYLVLSILWSNGEQTVGALGEAMQLDSGTLSPLIRRLEKSGVVARARGTADERVVTVQLTPAGHALRAEVAPIRERIATLSGMQNEEHRHRLIAELRELTALLQGASAPSATETSKAPHPGR